ncbi:class I SAM-dependent RNA methyltransferase [Pseudohoeflea coraliihabitans]|uniref:RNA methyltransferase n=1 Tax=Pseudohoeflea coraliihabitans TaxID=2860393 RepID=A0ABS6WLW4_9HYPH|nr:RNA methyltransferase [Pseudohoeflea sp. DP4N28-3]
MSAQRIEISELGAQGDGIGAGPHGATFVRFSAPGDVIQAAVEGTRGTLLSVLEPGDARTLPPCPHFGPDGENAACGGCAVQHIGRDFYTAWKRDLVISALKARGLETEVAPLVEAHPGERRRVVFAARRSHNGGILGFHRAGTHEIVDIATCLIATPRIVSALALLRALAAQAAVSPKAFQMAVLDSQSGFDIAFDAPFKLADTDRLRLVAAARKAASVARIAFNGEVLVEKQPPQLDFGGVSVTPPPGSFVQASARAETVMADLVSAHLKKAKRVADLYAGCGTFAARLACQQIVHAVEGFAPSLAALDRAMRRVQGFKPVSTEARDLARRPMMAAELKAYQGLVFDPPRAGAERQAQEIARSTVKRVAAVSCNPATLARDLRILIDGGYRLMSVTPIDQFLWTPHVEAVALLERPKS